MRLSEQLKVLLPSDRIRIIRGDRGNGDPGIEPDSRILYCGYIGMLQHTGAETECLAQDPEVIHLCANVEIRHKEYKERGLLPPYEPDITRMYEFKDLTETLYYDVYIR